MKSKLLAVLTVIVTLALFAIAACATTGGEGLTLMQAIEQSAEQIASELPRGSRVAIVAFNSESNNLSEFIMEELTGALLDHRIEVADRRNLEHVYKELNFQMSGEISDESALSIGKFLGVQLVVYGQLRNIGSAYRFTVNAVYVETATNASVPRLTVRDDRNMRNMIAAIDPKAVAARNAARTANTSPESAGSFYDRGLLFMSRGDYDLALTDLTEAININPNLTGAYLNRANIYTYQRVDFNRAFSDIEQALRIDPNNVWAYNLRGEAYMERGDYDRAISDFNQAMRIDPGSSQSYINRGRAYQHKQDYDRAIADFNQAIRINPDDAWGYANRGGAYLDKGDLDRALADFNQCLQMVPDDRNNWWVYTNRGKVYREKGDIDRAMADFDRAIQANPNDSWPYRERGFVYRERKDFERAIAEFNRAVQANPNDRWTYADLGWLYREMRDFPRAVTNFETYLRLDPSDAANVKGALEEARRGR